MMHSDYESHESSETGVIKTALAERTIQDASSAFCEIATPEWDAVTHVESSMFTIEHFLVFDCW